MSRRDPDLVMYLAVLPQYRRACMEKLADVLDRRLTVFISRAHLDQSVISGIPAASYTEVRMLRLFRNRIFIQIGGCNVALSASTTIVDLNPRSLTAWLILIVRRIMRRRTLVWGHLYPQRGANAKTAKLRVLMRRIAHGTVSYTYGDRADALNDLPEKPVWVAPNAIYTRRELAFQDSETPRQHVIYVGRFSEAKRVATLIAGFADFAQQTPLARLLLVGDGAERMRLEALVHDLIISDRVDFLGWINDVDLLRRLYESAFCSVSPGFAGLGLTQSLGFGVPMIIATNEPHSPEIELADIGGVTWFQHMDGSSLGTQLSLAWQARKAVPSRTMAKYIRDHYSAEAMANGLSSALLDMPADDSHAPHVGAVE